MPAGTRGAKAAPGPGDVTGLKKQKLEAEKAQERAERAEELAMDAATEQQERDHAVIDLTGSDQPLPEPEPEPETEDPYRTVRIKFGVDRMTFGRKVSYTLELDHRPESPTYGKKIEIPVLGNPNELTLEEGRQYKLPRAVADHLDERGYVFH